jgi:UDP-3-O-acyl-N-acetylglucosamine deacetylase
VSAGAAEIVARPGAGRRYRYELDYGARAVLGPQAAEVSLDAGDYEREVAPARTFCLEEEARAMRAGGLFGHVTSGEMLVMGAGGPIGNTLRFENEPARHKLLDLIGDLALVGRPIEGEIVSVRGGHALNHAMARKLVEEFGG